MSRHSHNWTGWASVGPDIPPEKRRFSPMWKRVCRCGQEQWLRRPTRPPQNIKFDQIWDSKTRPRT